MKTLRSSDVSCATLTSIPLWCVYIGHRGHHTLPQLIISLVYSVAVPCGALHISFFYFLLTRLKAPRFRTFRAAVSQNSAQLIGAALQTCTENLPDSRSAFSPAHCSTNFWSSTVGRRNTAIALMFHRHVAFCIVYTTQNDIVPKYLVKSTAD